LEEAVLVAQKVEQVVLVVEEMEFLQVLTIPEVAVELQEMVEMEL
jgi:hypothetical protein